ALSLPGIARWPGNWAAWVYPLTQIGTIVSKWWEITFFLAPGNLFLRRHPDKPGRGRLRRLLARWDLRLLFLPLGVVLHLRLAWSSCRPIVTEIDARPTAPAEKTLPTCFVCSRPVVPAPAPQTTPPRFLRGNG